MKHRALNAAILVLVFAVVAAAQSTELEQAIEQLRLEAEQGDASAQIFLGGMYYNEGVPQDYQEELKRDRRAAEQGDAKAQSFLNFMYCWGEGVRQDYQEALKWYRPAAEQGEASAQYTLGFMYASGQGLPQDYQEAVKWYRLAAEQGVASAQYNLGVMYDNGEGAPQDYVQAHKWINLAASRRTLEKENDLDYRSARDEVAEKMTASQVAEAQRLARGVATEDLGATEVRWFGAGNVLRSGMAPYFDVFGVTWRRAAGVCPIGVFPGGAAARADEEKEEETG